MTPTPRKVQSSGEALARLELFRNLPVEALHAIAQQCLWCRYEARRVILGYQDETQDVFFIINGQVRASYYSAGGQEVTFRDLSAGDMFGEIAAIDGLPRSLGVVALAETLVAIMPASVFWNVLRKHESVAAATFRRLARLVRGLSKRVVEFSTLAVRNRLHVELLRLARDAVPDSTGNTVTLVAPPTHAELASRISTHREAVTRELNDLCRAGLLEKRRGCLIIRDLAALKHMVSDVLEDEPTGASSR
jgi:CRP/FNR family transcriptional regulator, cyclic AMP receptor protein